MRMLTQTLPLVAAALLLLAAHPSDARRVRVRPAQRTTAATDEDASASAAADQETNPQQIRYYAAQPADADDAQQGGVVLVSSDPYNGLYGRPTARTQTDVSEAQLRSALASSRAYSAAAQQQAAARPRVKETAKQPPVQTIRNYSKVNDDGSFTFGYEAADGSFKEETRGTDCVVRGKYGYIDPDGNKREFTYVSGNPCDPNAVQEEEEDQREAPDSGEENIPKQPLRPLRPLRPTAAPATIAPRPTTTVFEQNYQAGDDAEDTIDDAPQHLFTPTPRTRYVQPAPTPSPTPGYSSYVSTAAGQPVRITPRPPLAAATTPRSQLPATTYRPQLLQLAVTPRPGVVYTKPSIQARPTVASAPQPTYIGSSTPTIDFDEELRKFQLENNVLTTPVPPRAQSPQPTPRPVHAQPVRAQIPQQQYQPQQPQYYPQQQQPQQQRKVPSGDPIYTSELVYDPATGQYNTVLYQQLPQTTGELNLRHRLQPYVHQPLLPQPSQQQSQQQPQSQYYQQQQAALLAQSQQLYAQQQQQRAIAQQQRFIQQQQQLTTQPTTRAPQRYTPTQLQAQPQPPQAQAQYYFVTPSANAAQGNQQLAQGQIEAFLRGHNIAF